MGKSIKNKNKNKLQQAKKAAQNGQYSKIIDFLPGNNDAEQTLDLLNDFFNDSDIYNNINCIQECVDILEQKASDEPIIDKSGLIARTAAYAFYSAISKEKWDQYLDEYAQLMDEQALNGLAERFIEDYDLKKFEITIQHLKKNNFTIRWHKTNGLAVYLCTTIQFGQKTARDLLQIMYENGLIDDKKLADEVLDYTLMHAYDDTKYTDKPAAYFILETIGYIPQKHSKRICKVFDLDDEKRAALRI